MLMKFPMDTLTVKFIHKEKPILKSQVAVFALSDSKTYPKAKPREWDISRGTDDRREFKL